MLFASHSEQQLEILARLAEYTQDLPEKPSGNIQQQIVQKIRRNAKNQKGRSDRV